MNRNTRKQIGRWMIPTLTLAGSLALFSITGQPAPEAPAEAAAPADVSPNPQQEEAAVEGAFLTEDERNAAIQLLKNRDQILRILGPGQVFIYDPTRLAKPFRDPMVIPWSRIKDLQDVLNRIQMLIDTCRRDEARMELESIVVNFPDNPFIDRVKQMLEEAKKVCPPGMTTTPTPTPRFPPKILEDTRAILYSETDPLVLIGADVLKPGDQVPAPGADPVTIKRIEPRSVIFEYKGVEYEKTLDALD